MHARYVALYETGERGGNYFRFVRLEFPDGMIPPPMIEMSVPHHGIHVFTYLHADTQAAIGSLFGIPQQTVGRWLKREAPEL